MDHPSLYLLSGLGLILFVLEKSKIIKTEKTLFYILFIFTLIAGGIQLYNSLDDADQHQTIEENGTESRKLDSTNNLIVKNINKLTAQIDSITIQTKALTNENVKLTIQNNNLSLQSNLLAHRATKITNNLLAVTRGLNSYVKGDSSFCFFSFLDDTETSGEFYITGKGENPIDLQAVVHNNINSRKRQKAGPLYSDPSKISSTELMAKEFIMNKYDLGTMSFRTKGRKDWANLSMPLGLRYPYDNVEGLDLTIFFYTQSSVWTEYLQIKFVNGARKTSIKVEDEAKKLLYEKVDVGFPK